MWLAGWLTLGGLCGFALPKLSWSAETLPKHCVDASLILA